MQEKSKHKGELLERILSAAKAEFAANGYAAASLSEIARRAGVSKQLVHHYFHDRNELYNAIVANVTSSILDLYESTPYKSLSPTEAITRLVSDIIDLHIVVPALATLTLDQGIQKAAHIDSESGIALPTRKFIQETVGVILRRGAESGEFRDNVDPSLFYTTVFHLAAGCFLIGPSTANITGFDLDSPEGIEVWRAHTLEFVLSYLKK